LQNTTGDYFSVAPCRRCDLI